jgi:hypothetical protein
VMLILLALDNDRLLRASFNKKRWEHGRHKKTKS